MANPITFLFLGTVPRSRRNLMGILLTARRVAHQLDPTIEKVLIKGSAHESSIHTPTGEQIKDPLHYTFQFKTQALQQRGTHWKAHAYITLDKETGKPISWYNTALDPVRDIEGRNLVEASDEYYHYQRKRLWNIWDPDLNQIKEFSEEILEGWSLGENWIASTVSETGKVSEKERDEVEQDLLAGKIATEQTLAQEAVDHKRA